MNNIFFTSDTHFCHFNILRFCNRPFNNVEEMNEILIEKWNSVVKKGDRVYHLGDFGFRAKDNKELITIFNRLNGSKYLIIGNHDDETVVKQMNWVYIKEQDGLRVASDYVWMNHFPMRSWNRSHYGSFHIYGHVHSKCNIYGKSIDVGCDAWDYTPVSFDTIKLILDKCPMINPEFDGLFVKGDQELFSGIKLFNTLKEQK